MDTVNRSTSAQGINSHAQASLAIQSHFDSQEPSVEVMMRISEYIGKNRDALTATEGMRVGDIKLDLIEIHLSPRTGRDESDKPVEEWCLLKRDALSYSFIPVQSARYLINKGEQPFDGNPLRVGDILRGPAVLTLLVRELEKRVGPYSNKCQIL